MKKSFKKIGNILTSFLIVILLTIFVIVIYSFVELDIKGKEYCNIFGYSIFQIETGSMEDALKIDDIIIVKLGNENIKENDVITFRQDNNLVTHRLIRMENNYYVTKGDNNSNEDEPVEKKDIIGKVEWVIHDVKVWKAVFKEPKVIISVVVTTILFILMIAYKEKIGDNNAR